MTLPEARNKFICESCCSIVFAEDRMWADNPFQPGDEISGCPQCNGVECFKTACQFDGCKNEGTGGYPGGNGFRYFWACHKHAPKS